MGILIFQTFLKLKKLNVAKSHRPFHPESEEYLKFKKSQILKIKELENEFSFLNFERFKHNSTISLCEQLFNAIFSCFTETAFI